MADRKLANAVAGKTARACDNCGLKRARWYCAADDAFLCQSCDATVHSANPLASRHERVRLKTASSSSSTKSIAFNGIESLPSWHQGFTRRARTPRRKKGSEFVNSDDHIRHNPLHGVVPEIGGEEQYYQYGDDEINEDEQLLFRVPILDPLIFEHANFEDESKAEKINEFGKEITSDVDAEFTADVECLLGKGLEDESFDMEELLQSERVVKVEDDEVGDVIVGMAQENDYYRIDFEELNFELNFDFDVPIICEEEEDHEEYSSAQDGQKAIQFKKDSLDCANKSFLKLDYEGVISAWDGQKSPWTTGERPEIKSGGWLPDCLSTSTHGEMGMSNVRASMVDRGREARVSRYREKRQTRLFSKKIRYEVRKLNAEKRPRMKGRFVKRSVNFAPPHVFSPSLPSK